MARLAVVSVLLAAALAAASAARETPKSEAARKGPAKAEPAARSGPQPGDVEVHFLNGSVVRMAVQSERLEVATPYGKLSVPVKDVRAVEFGLRLPEGYAARIAQAVKALDSADYRERDKASRELAELGPYSHAAVLEASRAKGTEGSRRAKEVLKKLQAKHSRGDLRLTSTDKVVTPTFTVVGNILTPSLKARTELFGEVELQLAKMRTLKAVGVVGEDFEVSVDAALYANAGQWLETQFPADGTPLVITAKGAVDTWPQGPGQYMVGPNGLQLHNRFGGGPPGIVVRRVGQAVGQQHGGMLLGKVGADGEAFIIGEHYEGTPEGEGNLYLHIGPSPWNCQSAGTYQVRIARKQ